MNVRDLKKKLEEFDDNLIVYLQVEQTWNKLDYVTINQMEVGHKGVGWNQKIFYEDILVLAESD